MVKSHSALWAHDQTWRAYSPTQEHSAKKIDWAGGARRGIHFSTTGGVIGHQGRIHPGRSANPSQGTHAFSFTHAITHYGQFRDANPPTTHVFGPGEETGVPGGNPRGTGRTCKLHTHTAEVGIEPPTLEV
ncbi:hypothetical protein QTP86_022300 [Hemibagrus guttatus]|nr:hypothetical protein QTP86_022300 [Hemibagrus guttatus]